MISRLMLVVQVCLCTIHGYYIPEFDSNCYNVGNISGTCKETIDVYVNRLVSPRNIISYDYNAFDFCQANNTTTKYSGKFGQMLFGDRIQLSPYKFRFMQQESCSTVCSKSFSGEHLKFLKKALSLSYENQWIIDNLPVTWCYLTTHDEQFCSAGFPIGCSVDENGNPKDACNMDFRFKDRSTYYLYNHASIVIRYRIDEGERGQEAQIVKVSINPRSHKHVCNGEPLAISSEDEQVDVTFTYSVTFVPDQKLHWETRWDYMLNYTANRIRWFAIANSLAITFISSAFFLFLCIRNGLIGNCLSCKGEKRWTVLRHDIFRPPKAQMLFCAVIAVGVQTILIAFGVLILASLGLLSPPHRGALATATIAIFVSSSLLSGFTSVKLYQGFGGNQWKANTLFTSLFISTIIFVIYFTLNIVLWTQGGSAATPGHTFVQLLVAWLGFSVPLTFFGAYIYRLKKFETQSTRHCDTPRRIPKQPLRSHILPAVVVGGILPFGCLFIELPFIFSSIWNHQLYCGYGFLLMTSAIVTVVSAEMSVFICYIKLVNEDYRWYWSSFLTSGSTAFYFFFYTIYYSVTKLEFQDILSSALCIGYSLIFTILVFLFCGTVGFFACYWFITKLYGTLNNKDEEAMELAARMGGKIFDPVSMAPLEKQEDMISAETCPVDVKKPEQPLNIAL